MVDYTHILEEYNLLRGNMNALKEIVFLTKLYSFVFKASNFSEVKCQEKFLFFFLSSH